MADELPAYDRSHPYYNAEHPDHAKAVEAVNEAFRRSTPPGTIKGGLVESDAQPATLRSPAIMGKAWLQEAPSRTPTRSPGTANEESGRTSERPGQREDSYSLQPPPPGDGGRWSQDTIEDFTATAQAVGISAELAQDLIDAYGVPGQPFPEVSLSAVTPEQGEATLRAEWGDEFTYRLRLAQWVVDGLDPRVGEFLETTGLANQPEVVKFFSREGARGAAQVILADRTHPAHNSGVRGHAEAVEWLQRLFALTER